MRRWPIRIRLTAVFTLAMALVLAVVGFVTVLSTRASLDESVDAALQYRLQAVRSAAAQQAPVLAASGPGSASQVLDAGGLMVAGTDGPDVGPLLEPAQATAAARGPIVVERPGAGELLPGPVRVAAGPAQGGRVAAAALSLADRDATVGDLAGELSVSFPLVLAVAAVGAYLLAAGLLRPVERMRARATAIIAGEADGLLPVPAAADEISRLGRTFNALLESLRGSLQRERRFVADASHDLRTPLSLLTTEIELALRRPRSAEELSDALRSALEETERLSRLAEDLLLLSSADRPAEPAPQATELLPVLDAVADRYRSHPGGEDVVVHCPPGLSVLAHRGDLDRAVENVVENALRHGATPVAIHARPAPAGPGPVVVIEVRDHGPGFEPEFLPRAFERFARADPARSHDGAGLGLAITGGLAHRNNGKATAANHPDGGAVLTLTLPAAQDSP